MKLHLECERTIHFQKVDGTQGVLKEGAQAYMHFTTSKATPHKCHNPHYTASAT